MRIYLQAENYIYKSAKETFSFSLKQNNFFLCFQEKTMKYLKTL